METRTENQIAHSAMKFAKIASFGLAMVLSSCGSQQFQTLATTQALAAPGSLQISPKVDVVLVEDDTGRIQESYSTINANAQSFLNTLDSEGWNYHFTTLRLTTPENVTQAVSSKQDPNWGSQWTPAYPGETEGGYGTNEDALNPSIFRTLLDYSGFLQQGQATNVLTGYEPGFLTMAQDFASSFNNTGFFRPDALLAVVMVGTGNDTSYVNYCWNGSEEFPCDQVITNQCSSISNSEPDGYVYPESQALNTECASGNVSMSYFLSQIQSVKSSTQQIKFYSATASINSAASGDLLCAGGYATPGTRYQEMAEALNGKTYDVCSQPLSSILSDVAQNLTSTALDYVQGYILLSTATQEQSGPDLSSIVVTKYVDGNPNNAVVIPQDPNNGWEYAGYLTNQATIIAPVAQNQETGYMLQLNGSGQLSGADYATITYKMANGQSAND